MNQFEIEHQITNDYYCNLEEYNINKESSSSSFKILSFNARSISSFEKFNKFKELISLLPYSAHILVIEETWFSPELTDMYQLPGYSAVFACRADNYGGIVMYIQTGIQYKV